LNWEVESTRTLHRQLVEMRDSGKKIEINMQWFGEPVGERLKTWGIPYQSVGPGRIQDGKELISVVADYPGGIHYRITTESQPATTIPAQGDH
jgi:hypothetical protein